MTHRRFHAPPECFAPDKSSVSLPIEESRHLRDVLRLKEGDEVFVFDGEGREYSCLIIETGRDKTVTKLKVREQVAPTSPESLLKLTLAVALLKGEKFDLVVQKVTELGVSRIVPVMTKRADLRIRIAGDISQRVTRWKRLALESCKQSGRARIPVIAAPISFSSLIEEPSTDDARMMFAERMGRGLIETFEQAGVSSRSLLALVGPEGGWDDAEISEARNAGWAIITFGGRTLRAETAAIVVTALLQHHFGDLR